MENVYLEAIALLKENQPFVMTTIVDGVGSTPRGTASKMIVRQDGSIFATIGGGQMEGDVIALAKQVFEEKIPLIHHFDMTNTDAALSDMICGGKGDVLLEYNSLDDLAAYEAAQTAIDNNEKGWLVSAIEGKKRCFCFVSKDNEIIGKYDVGNITKKRILDASSGPKMHIEEVDGIFYWTQSLKNGGEVYLFGGGHVACEIAKIAEFVGFETIVLDDREEFANQERFPNSKCMVCSFTDIPKLDINENSYIVIVTRGHLFDRQVLQWALTTNAGYIGMIGSRIKSNMIFDILRKQGVTQEQIDSVYTPIGLAIKAKTPQEIAISIVAELIRVRAEKEEVK